MLLTKFIVLSTLIFATGAHGQPRGFQGNLAGRTFVSKTLEYLKVLDDTTLFSSINSYTDTASCFLRNDTLFIRQKYLQTDQTGTKWMNELYDYEILALTPDTLQLKNIFRFKYRPATWEDTLLFVNIDNLKESVAEFKSLTLNFSSPWSGTRYISIDSLGKVVFISRPIPYSDENPGADKTARPKSFAGQLTVNEFTYFKDLLSKSLPSKLPKKRRCPLDGATSNFEIVIGGQNIKSTGCALSWIHSFLLNYLYDIDQNKGIVNKRT